MRASITSACAVPVDLCHRRGAATSPYLLVILIVKPESIICESYYRQPSSWGIFIRPSAGMICWVNCLALGFRFLYFLGVSLTDFSVLESFSLLSCIPRLLKQVIQYN